MPSARATKPRASGSARASRGTPTRTHKVERKTKIPSGGSQYQTTYTSPTGSQRQTTRRVTPIDSPEGGTETNTSTVTTPRTPNRGARNRALVEGGVAGAAYEKYSPTNVGTKTGASVGAIEAEFLACLFLIFLQLFTNTQDSYSDKMLFAMKRAFLVGILFFILALMAEMGPNATKISKALGGLVTVAILLSTASGSVLTTLDNFFKADWVANDQTASSGNVTNPNAAATAATNAAKSVKDAGDSYAAAVNSLTASERASKAFMDNFTKDFIESWNIEHPGEVISATGNQLVNAAKALSDAANASTDFVIGVWKSIF